MLITKEVKVFKKIIPIEELSFYSHKKVKVKCDNCGIEKEVKYNSYCLSTDNNTTLYYCNSKECINKKRNIVIQEKYGVNNVSQLESVKIKKIETCLENFGVEHPTQSNEVKDKIKKVNNDKFGKDWITQSEEFKEKSKMTNLERYGTEYATQSDKTKDKTKDTCKEKYNTDYYMKTKDFKEKSRTTNIEKYGFDYPSKSEIIQNKIKETNLKIYGVDRPTKSEKIKNKIKKNNLEKYGVDSPTKLNDVQNKMKNTCLEKYDAEFYSQSDFYKNIVKKRKIELLSDKYKLEIKDINDNIITLLCDKCNSYFDANYQLLYNRFIYNKTLCTNCCPVDSLSDSENQLQNLIKENYSDKILFNNREIIKPYELDVYIPELKLAFEFNGLFWHSELYKDKNYHLNKTEMCEKQGIQLIQIWEDDWIYKKNIVKSIILNKLGKSNKIYARKCIIKEITDNKLIRNFLNDNHIQGYIASKINIGLFYNDELVSLMSFGRKRKIMNSKTNNNEYEMYRFCNKLNINIIGGLNKLFAYFIKNYDYSKITSYVDRSYFNGNNYLKIGFNLNGKTEPNYYYIINNKREYRFKYRKDILVKKGFDKNKTEHQIMLERGIYRIYNSGNYRMIFE